MSEEQLPPEGQPPKAARVKRVYTDEERAAMGKRAKHSKNKGHGAERFYAKTFREAGWTKAKTARLVSRLLDNCKVDVAFIPVNAQIKAGTHRGMNEAAILEDMTNLINENFPEDDPVRNNLNVLIHHKIMDTPTEFAQKRKPTDSMVYMTFNTFFDLLCRLHEKGKYPPQVTVFRVEENTIQDVTEPNEEDSAEIE